MYEETKTEPNVLQKNRLLLHLEHNLKDQINVFTKVGYFNYYLFVTILC